VQRTFLVVIVVSGNLSLQEADDDRLPMTRSGPVKPMEQTTDHPPPMPQSSRAAVMSALSDTVVSTSASHSVPQASTASNGINLNSLMEDLDRNMTQQGVSTVPKGHCSACSKPIIGQVFIPV